MYRVLLKSMDWMLLRSLNTTRDGAAAKGLEPKETKREPAFSATYPIDPPSTIDQERFYRLPATAQRLLHCGKSLYGIGKFRSGFALHLMERDI